MQSMESLERQELAKFVYNACKTSPEGADLLISAFVQSLHSNRRSSVCIPFPNTLFSKAGDKDFSSAEEAVQHFPQFHRLSCLNKLNQYKGATVFDASSSSQEATDLAKSLQAVPLQSLKLLNWLLRVRSQLQMVLDHAHEFSSKLPIMAYQRVDSRLGCLPDFVLRVQEEDRGDKASSTFAAVKSRSGSIMAFHGTAAENLHSILRCGLLNLSNTSLQRNGAIFGEGIYLSTDLAVALGFCKVGKGWEHSCFGQRVKYVLLCEVAKGDTVLHSEHIRTSSVSDTSHKSLGTYIVVGNSDLVRLRYIFLYVEPSNVGVYPIKSLDSTGLCNPEKTSLFPCFKRLDWCKMIIVVYVVLLLGVAYLKSSAFKHGQILPYTWK